MRSPQSFRLVQNGVVNGAAQVISIVVGFLLLPYMLARMGTVMYGSLLIAQLFSISGVLAYADGGLAAASTRYMASAYAAGTMVEVRRVLATSLAAFLLLGLLLGLCVIVFAHGAFFRVFPVPAEHVADVRLALYIYAATLALHFGLLAIKGFFGAVQDLVSVRALETATRLLYAAGVVVVLMIDVSVAAVVAVEQVVIIAVAIAYVVRARGRYREAFTLDLRRASTATLRQIWGFGAHVFVNYFTTYGVYQRLPDLVISHFLGPTSLTYYAIISKVPRIIKTMTAAANSAATPFAAALEGLALREKLGHLVLRGARYSYLLLTPTVLFVVVFAEQILSLWMGTQYAWLANMLRVFVLWQYVMFFVLYTNATITRTEEYARLLPFTLIANVLFVAILLLTIERLGLWSVLVAFGLSVVVQATGSLLVQRKAHQFELRDLFDEIVRLPILVGGGVALLVFCALKLTFMPTSALGLIASLALLNTGYMLLVYRHGLGSAERTQLQRIVRQAVAR